jgi:hypothetical protein
MSAPTATAKKHEIKNKNRIADLHRGQENSRSTYDKHRNYIHSDHNCESANPTHYQ